jgi:hypothetical protein
MGARNNLSQSFLNALLADWEAHGREALQAARENEPATYCLMIAKLMPREMNLQVNASQALLDALRSVADHAASEPVQDEEPGLRRRGPVGHA